MRAALFARQTERLRSTPDGSRKGLDVCFRPLTALAVPTSRFACRRWLQPALAAALGLAAAGCFTFRSTITVRPDGSGTLTETLALSGPALRMVQAGDAPLSTPDALALRALALGAGVTVARSDTAGGVRTTVYAFEDIRALEYRFPDNATAETGPGAAVPPLFRFAFRPADAPGEPVALGVLVPTLPETAPAAAPDSAALARAVASASVLRVLMGDARATVELVVDGATVDSDADLRVGNTTTLVDLVMGDVLGVVEANPALSMRSLPPLDDLRRLGAGRGGIAVQAPGTVTVRFR